MYCVVSVLSAMLVEQHAKCCLSVLVLFRLRHAYVERYQVLPVIHIHIPEEPGNEASTEQVPMYV